MTVKEEIKRGIIRDRKGVYSKLFQGIVLEEKKKKEFIASLMLGHHILLLGHPGVGKTSLALRVVNLLEERECVKDCPINSYSKDLGCPWCEIMPQKEVITINPSDRVIRIQGSTDITPEDIIGDLDPEAALKYGIFSLKSFLPGKALRANHGILILDFIDRMPERALNVLLQAIDGDTISLSHFTQQIPLDSLVIATGSKESLNALPMELIDHFDIIEMDYIADEEKEKEVIKSQADINVIGKTDISSVLDGVMDIIRGTRIHDDIKSGVSTRGGISYLEALNVFPTIENREEISENDIRDAAMMSLPHRIKLHDFAASVKTEAEVIEEILNEVLGGKEEALLTLTKEEILDIATDIASRDMIKKPLKYGYYDILLKRIKRCSETPLAKLYQRIYENVEEEYKSKEELTEEMLECADNDRKIHEELLRYKREMEAKALGLTLEALTEEGILERREKGFIIGERCIMFLLEMLTPKVARAQFYGYGKHAIGKKSAIGEGRIVGARKYRLGDRYKDISYKDTIREVIRERREEIERDDIRINVKDIRTMLHIVLAVDLSGTMSELEKIWYAKEAVGTLAISSLRYKDRVGVVTFSNLADVLIDISDNVYEIMHKVIDLELHENAFTNIGAGIRKARGMLMVHKKSTASRHIILISDGDATAPQPEPEKFALREAIKAVRMGITISSVCINQATSNLDLMRKIARIGRGRLYSIEEEELPVTVVKEREMFRDKI